MVNGVERCEQIQHYPIGVICSRHDLCYHCYADDTQLYFVIKSPDDWSDVTGRCLSEISAWMKSNKLKLNEDNEKYIMVNDVERCEQIQHYENNRMVIVKR
jgi:hypothetical protein